MKKNLNYVTTFKHTSKRTTENAYSKARDIFTIETKHRTLKLWRGTSNVNKKKQN